MKRPSTPATLATISQALDGLSRHVEALDRDMMRLAFRVIPYEDEEEHLGEMISRHWQWPSSVEREKPTLDLIYKMLREADAHIRAIEYDFGVVRSIIERLENDVFLREELKPYLTEPPERRRRR